MEQELNFDTLQNVAYDISDIQNIPTSRLSELESLNVMTSDAYNSTYGVSSEDNKLQNAEKEVVDKTIDINVKEPNLILPRAELIRAIRYANVMIKKITNDIESSHLNITYTDDGKVVYRLKDNMTWLTLDGTCEVSNNNPITKTLSFNVSYLQSLVTTAGANKVLFYEGKSVSPSGEETDVIYIRLSIGDYIVSPYYGDESKLVPAGNKTKKISSIPAKVISQLCNSMLPLINDTQEVQSKRTIIYEDRAIFHSVTFSLQFKHDFNFRMCLGKKELELLYIVSSSLGDNSIDFYETDSNGENRILIVAPNITISTSVSIPVRDELTVMNLEKVASAKYIKINKDELKKVLFLSCLGTFSVARVGLNYNVDGLGLDAKVIGSNGDSSLTISGDNYNNIEPLNEERIVYSPNLTKLLKSFENGKEVEVALLEDGFAMKDDGLNISSSTNYMSV